MWETYLLTTRVAHAKSSRKLALPSRNQNLQCSQEWITSLSVSQVISALLLCTLDASLDGKLSVITTSHLPLQEENNVFLLMEVFTEVNRVIKGHLRTEHRWWSPWGNPIVQGRILNSKFLSFHFMGFRATFWQFWVSSGGTVIENFKISFSKIMYLCQWIVNFVK